MLFQKSFFILVAVTSLALVGTSNDAQAAIYVKIPGIPGDVTTKGYDNGEWFIADSFSFGVEREMKESGEKGGTADINIGVGELQEFTILKSMDTASAYLAQFAINGNSPGTAEIEFVETGGCGNAGEPMCYLKYKLERVFVKSWSISGDANDRPTEEVSFVYSNLEESTTKSSDSSTTPPPEPSSDPVPPEPSSDPVPPEPSSDPVPPEPRVPGWVQSTGKYWIDGDVSDREFTDAIGFLVNEKIIDVEVEPPLEEIDDLTVEEPQVPAWISRSTEWWINGDVPEDQFLEGIKWMIEHRIIRGLDSN